MNELLELSMEVVAIIALAYVGEAIVEYLLKDHLKWLLGLIGLRVNLEQVEDLVVKYVSGGVGILLAFQFQVDIPGMFGMAGEWQSVTFVVTGLLLGRGANFVHDFMKRYFRP